MENLEVKEIREVLVKEESLVLQVLLDLLVVLVLL